MDNTPTHNLVQLLATFDDDSGTWWLEPADPADVDQHDPESAHFVITVPTGLWSTWQTAYDALAAATTATIDAAGLDHDAPTLVHPCARYDEQRRAVRIAQRNGLPDIDAGYWPTCSICGHDRDDHPVVR